MELIDWVRLVPFLKELDKEESISHENLADEQERTSRHILFLVHAL